MSNLSPLEAQLLNQLQGDFPLVDRPYDVLAQRLNLNDFSGEDEAFDMVQKLKEEKIIRRLGAVFDANHLGYSSALCALAVENEADIDKVAEVINAYPYVTHNYERPNRYNIWFTLTTPDQLTVHMVLEEIKEKTGYSDLLYLPAVKLFKIQTNFDVNNERDSRQNAPRYVEPGKIVVEPLSELDKELVRQLQGDLVKYKRPFKQVAQEVSAKLAASLGYEISETIVLQRVKNWKFNKTMRRFGALLRHQKVGFTHNAMVVWDVPEKFALSVGEIMASQKEVSHCYERKTAPTWPYNFYSMIHGHSAEECEAVASRIVQEAQAKGIALKPEMFLYSTREFKKVSMKYFV
ncbi:MAG: Lrp/AsnC family transcriptional regulator [Coriobacteriia bacterium]|nr:Lrp/AsnC family transcriptional regulator [Coriobacteriia bacterium]